LRGNQQRPLGRRSGRRGRAERNKKEFEKKRARGGLDKRKGGIPPRDRGVFSGEAASPKMGKKKGSKKKVDTKKGAFTEREEDPREKREKKKTEKKQETKKRWPIESSLEGRRERRPRVGSRPRTGSQKVQEGARSGDRRRGGELTTPFLAGTEEKKKKESENVDQKSVLGATHERGGYS